MRQTIDPFYYFLGGKLMKDERPIYFNDPDALVDYVIDKVGKNITLGLCLGLGKPNHFANAIFC